MQIEKLVRDAGDAGEATSVREACRRLVDRLNGEAHDTTITPAGVNKWIERGSIPGPWLMRIATAFSIDLTAYG